MPELTDTDGSNYWRTEKEVVLAKNLCLENKPANVPQQLLPWQRSDRFREVIIAKKVEGTPVSSRYKDRF